LVVRRVRSSNGSPRSAAAARHIAHEAGSLRLSAMRHRREIGRVVSTNIGLSARVSRSVRAQFLKVIMPLNEKYALIAIPASHTASAG